MLRSRRVWLIGLALAVFTIAGAWFAYRHVRPRPSSDSADDSAVPSGGTSGKIIVSDQAQKNLKLTAKQMKVEDTWKTTTVPGMVVDRPGVSDRELAAPATGNITCVYHVPGDIVREGDVLFTLALTSDTIHASQADLAKAVQDLKFAEGRHEKLVAVGNGVPHKTVIEVENDIAKLKATTKGLRQELASRGFSLDRIDEVAGGSIISELPVVVPSPQAGPAINVESSAPNENITAEKANPTSYEVQGLKVELGQQVQAGQALCHLSNHRLLAIEGRAFRDETALLERSVKAGWPVEVDFQEATAGDWSAIEQTFPIVYIANTIDPTTRTFSFLTPLENQSKVVNQGGLNRLLWRFRPGQKVLVHVRVEELTGVFVVPADAVVFEGPDAFVFTQNVNTFERKAVTVLHRERDRIVLANDGSLPTYPKGTERWTIAAVARTAAAQLNRMSKSGSTGVPKGYHIHADGSLHKNEDQVTE